MRSCSRALSVNVCTWYSLDSLFHMLLCVLCVLQTLFVCFLRASMVTKVSPQLWDNLLAVLSSLTEWREVVQQWKVCEGDCYVWGCGCYCRERGVVVCAGGGTIVGREGGLLCVQVFEGVAADSIH